LCQRYELLANCIDMDEAFARFQGGQQAREGHAGHTRGLDRIPGSLERRAGGGDESACLLQPLMLCQPVIKVGDGTNIHIRVNFTVEHAESAELFKNSAFFAFFYSLRPMV
jgi:hypothetical protein